MIPEKVTWVRFPARINTVYSKLPPINDLFLKILNQTQIFAMDFLVECQIRKFYQLCCIRIQFIKTNSSTFPQTFCIFYADLAIPIRIPFQFIFPKLQNGNCQVANQNFPNDVFMAAEFWCIVGLTAVLFLLQRKDSTFL